MIKKVLPVLFFLLFLVFNCAAQSDFSDSVQKLLERAKNKDETRYNFALDNGAKIYQTIDKKSFYLLWFPPKADKKTIIVTLHGSSGYAFNEFYLWKEKAEKHGHGILALQWYFEGNKTPSDYYFPREIYDNVAPVLKDLKIGKEKAMLHGFSRGSANSYYVALYDRQSKTNYFGLILSNAGGASEDYPLYKDVTDKKFGEKPFAGLNWMTYCGGRDENPMSSCQAMQRTVKFIESYGGTIQLSIEDKTGNHGGFHRNFENIEKSLELFDKLVK